MAVCCHGGLLPVQAVARYSNKVESRNFMYKDMGDVMGRVVFR